MTQFKDKSARQSGEFISAGLFTYPALQAADILLYDADRVPVGDDQRQHLELTRDIAVRFNHRYGETFVVPEAVHPRRSAPGSWTSRTRRSKMSKSADSPQGTVLVLDPPEVIERKFKRAVTDADTEVALRPGRQAGRVQPAVDPGRRHRPHAAGRGRRLHPVRRRSRPTPPRPSSSCCGRCRSATGSWRPTRPR